MHAVPRHVTAWMNILLWTTYRVPDSDENRQLDYFCSFRDHYRRPLMQEYITYLGDDHVDEVPQIYVI